MAIPNQVIIDSPVNTVNIETNNNSLKIISPVCNTEVTVTQPVTNIIQVATPGNMGPQGPAGPSGSIGSLNTASLATTGSNIFVGNQIISGSGINTILQVHSVDDQPWAFGMYNDNYNPTQSVLAGWVNNTGEANIGTEVNEPLQIYTNANYGNPTLIISSSGVTITNKLTVNSGITGSLQGTASLALTASYINPLVQNVSLTGSLKVTGSIEINNTNIQYYKPQSVLFLPPVYTLVTSASTTYNVHVTQSGPYFIDCSNIPINTSCSVNFYVYPDLMPSGFVANLNVYTPISTGSNSSLFILYRTIVSASNSTSYYQQGSSPIGSSTQQISRFSFNSKPSWVSIGAGGSPGWFFKTPSNQVILSQFPRQDVQNPSLTSIAYFLYTGSQGTPIP